MREAEKKEIVYRKMGISDIEEVIEIEKQSFSIPWTKEMFMEELGNPNATYLVATSDDKVIAYAGAWIILDEAHITNIAVSPVYRGRHIAFHLMQNILDMANQLKLTGLTLEVRASNTKAISLYERFGFVIAGRRKAYYTDNQEDAFIMWCYIKQNNEI